MGSAIGDRSRINIAGFFFALAFACRETWLYLCFYSQKIEGSISWSGELLDGAYLYSSIFFAGTLLIAALLPLTIQKCLAKQYVLFGSIVLLTVTTAMLILSMAGYGFLWVFEIAGALSGIAMGVYSLYLAFAFARIDLKTSVASVIGGQALAPIIYNLLLVLPTSLFRIITLVLPLISLMALLKGTAYASFNLVAVPTRFVETMPECTFKDRNVFKRYLDANKEMLPNGMGNLVACLIVVGFLNEANRAIYSRIAIEHINSLSFFGAQSMVTILVVVGAIALLVLFWNGQEKGKMGFVYRFMFGALFLSTLSLPFIILFPLSEVFSVLPYAINSAAYRCFGMFTWAILVMVAQKTPHSVIRVSSLVMFGWSVGQLLGQRVERLFLAGMPISMEWAYVYIAFVLAALVAIVLSIFPESKYEALITQKPKTSTFPTECANIGFEESCQAIAAYYQLSPRETEVLMLLARGRNSNFIQQELCLSKSTVSTHRQNIYQKLGIHSLQELIDLVENREWKT